MVWLDGATALPHALGSVVVLGLSSWFALAHAARLGVLRAVGQPGGPGSAVASGMALGATVAVLSLVAGRLRARRGQS